MLVIIQFTIVMCRLNSIVKSSDLAHEYAVHITGDPTNIFYCKFCKITVGITGLKHPLACTKQDVNICAQVLVNVKQACKDMLLATEL